MDTWKQALTDVLHKNILRYWIEKVTDHEHGGYYGRVDGHDKVHPEADKGAIMNARVLWSFSAAYRVTRKPEYLEAATRARDYLVAHFLDHEHGGVYWSVDCLGNPKDTKKQTYAIGFAIYGFSEYARATGDKQALDVAISLYRDIEAHAFDPVGNGYIEALTRDWQPIGDMRLSDKDENCSRTMNTHLHILEPYTNLYRVWPDEKLRERLVNLVGIFTGKLLNPQTYHLDLFFDDQWQGKRDIVSYGHDIEASWLLHETVLVLGDRHLTKSVAPIVKRIAQAADEGLRKDGSMIYERWIDTDHYDLQRQWWVECECVIGHVNLFQHFGDEVALDRAVMCWNYIQSRLIDAVNGEWHWSVDDNGVTNLDDDKAGFWKCPYHNTRMCLELIERNF